MNILDNQRSWAELVFLKTVTSPSPDYSRHQLRTEIARICLLIFAPCHKLPICMPCIANNFAFRFLGLFGLGCRKVVTAEKAFEMNGMVAWNIAPGGWGNVHSKCSRDQAYILRPMEVCTKHLHTAGDLQFAQPLYQILWSILGSPAEVSEVYGELFDFHFASDTSEGCGETLHLQFPFVDAPVIS